MGKAFDEFAKSLASGQSRRGALTKLVLGVAGAVGLTIVGKQDAEAGGDDGASPCAKACLQVFGPGVPLAQCIIRSRQNCPAGSCSILVNGISGGGTLYLCVPVGTP